MLSQLKYRDYAVLLFSLDAEWTRQGFSKAHNWTHPFAAAISQFTTNCWRFREGMTHYRQQFKNFVPPFDVRPGEGREETAIRQEVDPRLFNPVCYVPFGHADAIGLVLVDDCEITHHLAESATTTIESLSLAFCPDLSSLGVAPDNSLFCELDAILGNLRDDPPQVPRCTNPSEIIPDESEPWRYRRFEPAEHKFEATMPLLVFSTYKIDGLGTVGPGVLLQQAVFRAMVGKIQAVVDSLGDVLESEQAPVVQSLLTREDLKATRCALLDLQGGQEIGTLIFCRNATVAASILSGLRRLTFQSLIEADVAAGGSLLDYLNQSKVHAKIFRCINQLNGAPRQDSAARIPFDWDSLSVFRWTYSTTAVAWNTFRADLGERRRRCGGLVEASTDIQIAPGRRLSAFERLQTRIRKDAPTPTTPPGVLKYHRYLMGSADLRLFHGQARAAADAEHEGVQVPPGLELLPLSDAIEVLQVVLREFGCDVPQNEAGRDVADCRTTLTIPVPRVTDANGTDLLCGTKGERHIEPLKQVLRHTRQRLCYPSTLPEDERAALPPEHGQLAIDRLAEVERKNEVPQSLSRSINSLFRHFATLLGDPFLFDVVLDLYDPIAATHAVLEERLPLQLGGNEDSQKDSFVSKIAGILEALDNALEHRVAGAFREPSDRDMAIDFRGGLQQMLLAADVPIKCGLGVLRRFVRRACEPAARNTVGVPVKIEFRPGIRIEPSKFGEGDRGVLLGFMAGDVPHVLNVAQYGDHLHEAFHLVLEEICEQKAHDAGWPLSAPMEKFERERLTEIFAMFLCQLFLCRGDAHGFRRHSAISFSKGLEGKGKDDRLTYERHVEWLIRLFLATDILDNRSDLPAQTRRDPARWGPIDRWVLRPGDSAAKRIERFKNMLDDLEPFLPDFRRLRCGRDADRIRAYAVALFSKAERSVDHLLALWSEALNVYRRFLAEIFPGEHLGGDDDKAIALALANLDAEKAASYEGMLRDVDAAAEKAISEGRVLLRACCPEPYRTGEDHALDPLLVVCALLRGYMHPGAQATQGEWCLTRETATRRIKIDPDKTYHEFLVDRGAGSMFSAVPCARRARLRKQIAVWKTFWDVSSALRARRLLQLLDDNWAC